MPIVKFLFSTNTLDLNLIAYLLRSSVNTNSPVIVASVPVPPVVVNGNSGGVKYNPGSITSASLINPVAPPLEIIPVTCNLAGRPVVPMSPPTTSNISSTVYSDPAAFIVDSSRM